MSLSILDLLLSALLLLAVEAGPIADRGCFSRHSLSILSSSARLTLRDGSMKPNDTGSVRERGVAGRRHIARLWTILQVDQRQRLSSDSDDGGRSSGVQQL